MIDIQERLTAFAMLGATWVMWLLVILSIIGVAIIFERIYYFFVSREDVRKLQEDLRLHLAKNDIAGARERLSQSRSFQARIVYSGIEAVDGGPDAVEERLQGEAAIARTQMERNLGFLGTVGNNAPFVGLLGTVIGVIKAFHVLDESAGKVTSGLMTEVGEALVATAIGILVALPAVAFFNYFQRLIRYRLTWADALGRELLAYLKGGENEKEHG
jgi:biopolymer transport protein ExbB